MSKIKDSLSLFVIVNASALYIIYFIIKNLSIITASLISALSSLLSGNAQKLLNDTRVKKAYLGQ